MKTYGFWQLICFYFVWGTMTSVGYGAWPFLVLLSRLGESRARVLLKILLTGIIFLKFLFARRYLRNNGGGAGAFCWTFTWFLRPCCRIWNKGYFKMSGMVLFWYLSCRDISSLLDIGVLCVPLHYGNDTLRSHSLRDQRHSCISNACDEDFGGKAWVVCIDKTQVNQHFQRLATLSGLQFEQQCIECNRVTI